LDGKPEGRTGQKVQGGARLDRLAQDFERTKGAIISELVKQGLVEQAAADEMR